MDLITRYIALANEFGSLYIDLLIEGEDIESDIIRICNDLNGYSTDRSNSMLTLIRAGQYWDAEIIARPLIECTVRSCFICYSPKDVRASLAREYLLLLPEINRLNQSERAKKVRPVMRNGDKGNIDIPSL